MSLHLTEGVSGDVSHGFRLTIENDRLWQSELRARICRKVSDLRRALNQTLKKQIKAKSFWLDFELLKRPETHRSRG
jgi:hypothetical protein